MVIVRAKFPQGWRGDRYDQDEKMPATDEQGRRLTQAGVAYYDFEDDAPTSSSTVEEIKKYLNEEGIDYTSGMLKKELLELIDG